MNLEEAIILSLQGKLDEARSHKEDNEAVAPRKNTEKVFGELADTPKRDRLTGRNGWGYKDAQATEENEKGISKDIDKYKTLKSFAKDARASAEAYNDTARHWDEKATELVQSKRKNEDKSMEADEISSSRAVELIINAIEWAIEVSEDTTRDVLRAMGITEQELKQIGYDGEDFDNFRALVENNEVTSLNNDASDVINSFKNKDEMYNYVITLIQENVTNNEELLDKCRQILDKGAIATFGADVMKTFYEKFKDKIEQRINELGEEYIGAVLAEYVFEDVVYGLEDNLQDTLA